MSTQVAATTSPFGRCVGSDADLSRRRNISAQDNPLLARATDLGHCGRHRSGDYRTARLRPSPEKYPADHGLSARLCRDGCRHWSYGRPDIYEQWLRRSRHEDVLPSADRRSHAREIGLSEDVGLADALKRPSIRPTWPGRRSRRAAPEPAFDRVLAGMGDEAAKARLVEELAGQSSRERLAGLRDIAGLRGIPPAAVSPLLTDPAPPVRAAAAEALGQMHDAGAVSQLRPLLEDPDPYVQATTAVALARLGDPDGRQAIVRMAGSDIGDTAAMAADSQGRGVDVSPS